MSKRYKNAVNAGQDNPGTEIDPLVNSIPITSQGGSAAVLTPQVTNGVEAVLQGFDAPLLADVKQFGPTWDPPLPLVFTGTSGPGQGQTLFSLDKLVIGLVRTGFNSPPFFTLYSPVDYIATSRGWTTFVARTHDDPMKLTIRYMTQKDGVVLATQTFDELEFMCNLSIENTFQVAFNEDIFLNANFCQFSVFGGLAYKC